MRRRGFFIKTGRALGGDSGAVTVMAIVTLPALFAILLGAYELGILVYTKAQLRSIATASALAAVGKQKIVAFPIPTKLFPGTLIPYDGWLINLIYLPNVRDRQLVADGALIREFSNRTADVKVETFPSIPFPFRWVKVTAALPWHGLARHLSGQKNLTHEACALTWVRFDYMAISTWYSEKTLQSVKTSWRGMPSVPLHFYRLVPCEKDRWKTITEVVAEQQLSLSKDPVDQAFLQSTVKTVEWLFGEKRPASDTPPADKPATTFQVECEGSNTVDLWDEEKPKSEEELRRMDGDIRTSCEERKKAREARENENQAAPKGASQ